MADFQQGRQTVVDRLKRRLNNYRNHNTVSNHHFEATVDAIYGDQHKQTLLLKQRHIESKVKKTNKKSDTKKQDSASLLSAMGQSKLLARGHDQATGSGDVQDNEPAAKKQRIANGMVNSAPSDASDFQIVHQLHSIKNSNSPSSVPQSSGGPTNPIPNSSVSALTCPDSLEALGDNALSGGDVDETIKKENELELPNDSLLEDFGELSNFEDIDMGINLEDFVHDLDLDNIKHENSNSGMDTFFKEEVVENLFDDPPNVTSDNIGVNVSKSTPMQTNNKIPTSVASPAYPQYSNTSQPIPHSSTPSSFSQSSFSSSLSQQFTSSNTSLSTPFTMTSCLPKIRVNTSNMNMGQNDMVLAAQTLKQMAEQHQTKLSPNGNAVRSNMADFSYSSLSNGSMINQSTSVPNQIYNNSLNQANPMYNQSIGNEMEMKRRQQMMHQFSLQHMPHQQSNAGHCNQPGSQAQSPGIQQGQTAQHQHKQVQQQSQVQQIQPQSSQHSQTQQPQAHHQATPQHQQQASQLQQQTPQQQQTQQLQQQQQQQASQHQPPSQLQQQQQQPSSQLQQQAPQPQPQVQQTSQQQSQMRNSLSPFSNRMSPLNSYVHSPQAQNQLGMSPQFVSTMCAGIPNSAVRGSYPAPTRSSSPIPAGPQGQSSNIPVPSGAQPRFMQQQQQQQQQQQMMGSVGMMRPQMMAQSGQMMARPPPPEYRQAAMMQQHQAMIGEPMSQTMPQMHQGMGQMAHFQGMRPSFRQNMGGSPVGSMSSGQIIPGMGQQSIPANLPSIKGSVMQGSSMGIPVTIGGPMGQSTVGPQGMGGSCLSVSMNQVSGGANMGIVNTRPTMIQRARPPNINMGIPGMGMSTQMPPSRPEWRQMMMQQNQAGMMMGPGIRHSYQQPQGGGMMGQGNPMMVQRPQAHMMNIVGMQGNPGMQHTVSISSGPSMQSTASISVSHNNPGMQTLPPGVRLQQHNSSSMGPGQVHPGIQMNQQGMHDSRNTVNMPSQGHGGSPSSLTQMGVATSTSLGHHGASGGPPNMSQIGGNAPSGLNHMSNTNMNPLPQAAGGTNTTVNPVSQTQNANLSVHPRSPATLMHPCSPAAAGAGAQQRPLSNPSLGLTTSSQAPSGSCSPLLVCSSSSGMATPSQGRPAVVGGNLPPGRTTIQNSVPQAIGGLTQGVGPVQQGHPISQGNNNISNSASVMIGQSGSGTVSGLNSTSGSQRPDSRGGNTVKTSGETQTPNPPSSSASNDFDLMFNEGEFAALLS